MVLLAMPAAFDRADPLRVLYAYLFLPASWSR